MTQYHIAVIAGQYMVFGTENGRDRKYEWPAYEHPWQAAERCDALQRAADAAALDRAARLMEQSETEVPSW